MIVQTSDKTWQAYNTYGGNSTYTCSSNCPTGTPLEYKGASKVSYNRPFNTAVDSCPSWLMSAEYPMIRFLEANGYDVSYTSASTSGRRPGVAADQPQGLPRRWATTSTGPGRSAPTSRPRGTPE